MILPTKRHPLLLPTISSVILAALAVTSCGQTETPAPAATSGSAAAATASTAALPAADSVEAVLALPMEQLIAYEAQIKLTAAQEEIKRAALEAIPAPCCSDRSAYTCCCACNLRRAWWGLSELLITEHGQTAAEVQSNVQQWFRQVRPQGFRGDSCYTGRCASPAQYDGCSGMDPNHLAS